jgi:hypothetical protein
MKVFYLMAIYGGSHDLLAVNQEFEPLREKAIELAKAKWGDTFYVGIDTEGEMRISEVQGIGIYDILIGSIELNGMGMVDAIIRVFKRFR